MSFHTMSIRDIHEGLVSKCFSAQEIISYMYQHINEHEPNIHAYIQLTPELAFQAALAVDGRIANGDSIPLLAGVPLGIKDNINLVGTNTTCASKMLENYSSPYTATSIQKCLDAGAIPLGKTNMDEFAFGSSCETSYFGPTYNPWNTECVPGGSSGGSAAAVASGMATVALGSDTGGSIRQPGAFCGVVAYKPSYGLVSRYGVVAFASSLDQVGPFGRSVEDVAYVMDTLTGNDPLDSTSQSCPFRYEDSLSEDIGGMKIGVVPSMLEMPGITSEVKEAYFDSLKKLEAKGVLLKELAFVNIPKAISAYYVIGPCEAFSNLSRFDSVRYGHSVDASTFEHRSSLSRSEGFGPEVKRRILLGAHLLSSSEYEKYHVASQKVRTLITQEYKEAFETVDAIIMPTSPCSAFKVGEVSNPNTMYLFDYYTISINIAGNCGMHIPTVLGKDSHMPLGVQLVGPQFGDNVIFKVGKALETCYDMKNRLGSCVEGVSE